jgi:hypothetical protein
MAINYEQEIIELVRTLSDDQKQQMIDYLRILKRPETVSGKEFLERIKDIRISDNDAADMLTAIDEAFNVIEDIEVSLDD